MRVVYIPSFELVYVYPNPKPPPPPDLPDARLGPGEKGTVTPSLPFTTLDSAYPGSTVTMPLGGW